MCRAEGYVHPDAFGRGIGKLIATGLEGDAARGGARRIQNGVSRPTPLLAGCSSRLATTPCASFASCASSSTAPPPAPEWPDGLRVVPFDPERDALEFHAAHQEAFADHWEHTPLDVESWSRATWRASASIRRSGASSAPGRDRRRTICTGDTYGGGWIHALFTRRPSHKRGVGAALLGDAFRRLWERGERGVGLGVDTASDTGAFRLYERAGMAAVLGWVMYEKELGATT